MFSICTVDHELKVEIKVTLHLVFKGR